MKKRNQLRLRYIRPLMLQFDEHCEPVLMIRTQIQSYIAFIYYLNLTDVVGVKISKAVLCVFHFTIVTLMIRNW